LGLIWEAPQGSLNRRELIAKDEKILAVMLVGNARSR
jgi:hypothetical protein